jgi:hypothetical protein
MNYFSEMFFSEKKAGLVSLTTSFCKKLKNRNERQKRMKKDKLFFFSEFFVWPNLITDCEKKNKQFWQRE